MQKLNNINENLEKLDLTNLIFSQIVIFLNDDSISYIDSDDQRIINNPDDHRILNKLMNILLDKNVQSNFEVLRQIEKALEEYDEKHPLKENISNILKKRNEESLQTNNRFDELEKRNRGSQSKNHIKYKNINGFIPIYKKPRGVERGDLDFKLISRPASEKEFEEYSNSWEKSKYFNIWMRKDAENPKEIYMTKLVSLLYSGKEDFYKVRSPSDNKEELSQILIKFIPNVKTFEEFKDSLEKNHNSDFKKIQDKIDKVSFLKFLISNFIIQNSDVNSGNVLIKETDHKIKFIPIDFSHFSDNKKENEKFLSSIQNGDFKEARNVLLKYAKDYIPDLSTDYIRQENNKIQKNELIDFNYQLNNISDKEFKDTVTKMLSQFSEIKNMLDLQKTKKTKEEKVYIRMIQERILKLREAVDSLENEKIFNSEIKLDSLSEIGSSKLQKDHN